MSYSELSRHIAFYALVNFYHIQFHDCIKCTSEASVKRHNIPIQVNLTLE